MGEFIDKAKGLVNEAIGKAKIESGQEKHDNDAIVEGAAQEIKGKVQQVKGDIKGKIGNKF